MKSFVSFAFVVPCVMSLALAGCSAPPTPAPTATPAPTPTAVCTERGTTVQDKVPLIKENRHWALSVYLPPCYAGSTATYPVLYWTAVGGQEILDTVDRLIRRGELPPVVVAMLEVGLTDGLGADGRIIKYVVPYVDAHYRTQPDPAHRSITGISHGAAIAIRTALQPPDLFGRVAVISGGIVDSEQEKFTGWLASTPRAAWPAILIDVGDKDAIIALTHSLIVVLDQQGVPYTFTQGQGGHDDTYWGAHMAAYLTWLVPQP